MTKYVVPKCNVYCVLQRGSARRANKHDQICCSEVYVVLFFARESARVAHTYDPICCPEVYVVLCFLQGKVLAWPTHMTKYVAPKCTLYFFARESARRAHTYDQICCSKVYSVLFFARES